MKKPPGKKAVVTGESAKLTHSPFAALRGAPPLAAVSSEASEPGEQRTGSGEARATPAADSGRAVASASSAPGSGAPGSGRSGTARKSRGRLVLRRETKHRGGKAVIVVAGFDAAQIDDATLEVLAKTLKRTLGCGGTVERGERERELILQGDHAAKVAELLTAEGFRVAGVTS